MSEVSDVWADVDELTERIHDLLADLPADALTEGFRMTDETRADLSRAVPLLRQALEIIEAAQAREEPIYNKYCELRDARNAGHIN